MKKIAPQEGRQIFSDQSMFLDLLNSVFDLFDLEVYCPFSTVKVMSSQSVNLLTLFPGQA